MEKKYYREKIKSKKLNSLLDTMCSRELGNVLFVQARSYSLSFEWIICNFVYTLHVLRTGRKKKDLRP